MNFFETLHPTTDGESAWWGREVVSAPGGCAGSSLLEDFSRVAASRGFSLIVMWGLLIVVASLAAELRLCSNEPNPPGNPPYLEC